MKAVCVVLCLCVVTNANNSFYDVICNDNEAGETGLLLKPLEVRGRFLLEWCTPAKYTVNKWKLSLTYYSSLSNPEQCNSNHSMYHAHHIHSTLEAPVSFNTSCTNVCFTATLDAIFSSTCYRIFTQQVRETEVGGLPAFESVLTADAYHYVRDNDTNTKFTMDEIINGKALHNYQNDGNDTVVDWYLVIPAYVYYVHITPNGTNEKIYMNCSTVTPAHVRCRARAAPGAYRAELTYDAPWTSLIVNDKDFSKIIFNFNHTVSSALTTVPVPASAAALWWALGGAGAALLLALLLLLLLLLRRDVRSDRFKQNTLLRWIFEITQRLSRREPRAVDTILLLYARDCEDFQRAAKLLAQLLHRVTGCEVVDLYSAEAAAAAAAAGAAWLRALLQRRATSVLLLQSPALALYCVTTSRSREGLPTLEAPLLYRRVAWRVPHAADAQLLLALRLLADAALADPPPYKKYYIATVAGLEHVDAVSALTPLRRYVLPDATRALLTDVAPALPPPTLEQPTPQVPLDDEARLLLAQFASALDDFRQYARGNDKYWDNILVFE